MLGLQVATSNLLAEYKRFTKDSTSENETVGKQRIQHVYNQLLADADNATVDHTRYADAKDGQRSFLMPNNYIQVKTIRFKHGDSWHKVEPIESDDRWHEIVTRDFETSIPDVFRVKNSDGRFYLELDPIPDADATDNIEMIYEGYHLPLLFPTDHTDGTVSMTNGASTVTGNSSNFTSAMARRFIKPDGARYWYEIQSYNSAASLTLVNNFEETTVSGGNYTIAELMRIPPEFSYTPVYGAAEIYWAPKNKKMSKRYGEMFAREYLIYQNKFKSKTGGNVMRGKVLTEPMLPKVPLNYPKSGITG